jgi:uncharacterized protein with gpF-like domain
MRYLLDQNRAREWRRQTALMQRLENQFAAQLSTEIYNAMTDMVDRWLQTGEVIMPRGYRDKLEETYRAMIVAAATSFGVRIWQQAKSLGVQIERKEDFAQTMLREALKYIFSEAIRQRIAGVAENTRSMIIRAIARGFEEGLGQKEIADLIIEAASGISQARAALIARTEVHGAANYGALYAAKRTGVASKKEWLSAQDHRTRAFDNGDEWDHLNYDGTTVGMDESFAFESADGRMMDVLKYPGDPTGAAGNVINCRCTLAFAVDLEAFL